MYNWEDLKYFIHVANKGSYAGAAGALGVNQTTVSRRIKALETQLGLKLFSPAGVGISLTHAGELLIERARGIEHEHIRVIRLLRELDDEVAGVVNLTMPHDIFSFFLADILARFRQQYPEVELNVSLTNDVKDVAVKESDVALRISTAPPEALIGQKISDLRGGLYGTKGLDTSKPVGLVLWEDERELPAWASEHFDDCFCAMRVNDLTSFHAAVSAGIGVGNLPCYIHEKLAADHVIELELDAPKSPWALWILTHVEVRQAARIKILKDYIQRELSLIKGIF